MKDLLPFGRAGKGSWKGDEGRHTQYRLEDWFQVAVREKGIPEIQFGVRREGYVHKGRRQIFL